MKHVNELARIYNLLDVIESHVDVATENKVEALTLLTRSRGVVAHTLHELEELEDSAR